MVRNRKVEDQEPHRRGGAMKMTPTQRSRKAKKVGLVQAPRGFVTVEQAKVIQMWIDEGDVMIEDGDSDET